MIYISAAVYKGLALVGLSKKNVKQSDARKVAREIIDEAKPLMDRLADS